MKKILYFIITLFNIFFFTNSSQKIVAANCDFFDGEKIELSCLNKENVLVASTSKMHSYHKSNFNIYYNLNENYDEFEILEIKSFNVVVDILNDDKCKKEIIFHTENVGEFEVKIKFNLLKNGNNSCFYKKIYMFAMDDIDCISFNSLGEAKFDYYLISTGNYDCNYENYDKFYSQDSYGNSYNSSVYYLPPQYHNVNIFGYVTWLDANYNSHGANKIKVEVITEDLLGCTYPVAYTYTNNNGYYNVVFNNLAFSQGNVKLKFSTEGGGVRVVNYYDVVYSICSNNLVNIQSSLQYNYQIDERNFAESEKYRAFAFETHQSIVYGNDYVESKTGNRLPQIDASYPSLVFENNVFYEGGTYFEYIYNVSIENSHKKIFVSCNDTHEWDVILHEYGHYFSFCFGFFVWVGGEHYGFSCLNEIYRKEDGMLLSWSEGFATYFSISSQIDGNASTMNIPNVGDLLYNDIDYDAEGNIMRNICLDISLLNTSYYNVNKYGESDESMIVATLHDLADGSSDYNVNLGYSYILNLIIENQCKTFSEFSNALQSNDNDFAYLRYGDIFSNSCISPSVVTPTNIYDAIPTFYWTPQGGNGTYQNNVFSLVFFDENQNFICETNQTVHLFYKPTYHEWSQIIESSNLKIYWAVKAWQRTYCSSGLYITGPYYSNCNETYFSQEILLNTTFDGTLYENEVHWFRFSASVSGNYIFKSLGDTDTFGELFSEIVMYDSQYGLLAYDDNSGVNNNFEFSYYLNAGEEIYLRVTGNIQNMFGDYSILILRPNN